MKRVLRKLLRQRHLLAPVAEQPPATEQAPAPEQPPATESAPQRPQTQYTPEQIQRMQEEARQYQEVQARALCRIRQILTDSNLRIRDSFLNMHSRLLNNICRPSNSNRYLCNRLMHTVSTYRVRCLHQSIWSRNISLA